MFKLGGSISDIRGGVSLAVLIDGNTLNCSAVYVHYMIREGKVYFLNRDCDNKCD